MADLISEVIDLQVFEQVKKLTADLETLYSVMDKTIALGAGNNKIIDPQGMKAATDATNNLNTTVTKLMETESERLNIERQIKAEGEKMAASVKIQSNAIEQAAAKYKMFSNSQKELAQYIMETDRRLAEIKTELKNADTSASNYAEATANLKIEQAKLKAELSEATKELKRTVTEQKFADDSMKGMSVRLLQLKDLYSQFTETERNSEFGQTISQGINELDEKLKGLDKSIGDNQRSVGNYEVAGKSLKMELREIVQELALQKMKMDEARAAVSKQEAEVKRLANTVGTNSSEYQEAKIKLDSMTMGLKSATAAMTVMEKRGGEIKDAMDDARTAISGMANDAGNTAAVSQGVGVLADSFSVFQAGMAAVGFEGEDMMRVYAKMMIVQQGVNSLTQITNALQSESVLRLKLKAIWDKVSLAFTEKKTAATVKETAAETVNAAATTAGATATAGLATAEGVATTTSWTLVGSLKAVGAAIKSIPVIGWILAAVAALGTLTVLLYKHLSAEKELTAEQERRKQLSKEFTEINMKANESTLETVTRVQLLQKGLTKVKKGSEEWKNIVKEISELTGLQLNSINNSEAAIKKATNAWIEQYKIRAKAEATIQQIVQSELEYERLRAEFLDPDTEIDRRKEIAETLKLTDKQRERLIEFQQKYKSNADAITKKENYKAVINLLDLARQNMVANNSELEKSINLEWLYNKEVKKGKDTKEKEKPKDVKAASELELLKLKQQISGQTIDLEKQIADESVKVLMKEYEEKKKLVKGGKEELYRLDQEYALKEQLIYKTMNDNINTIKQKQIDDMKKNVTDEIGLTELLIDKTNDYIKALEKLANVKDPEKEEKRIALIKERISATGEMVDAFSSLGGAIAANIKDEKKRIIVEQRIAEVQIALSHALAIAQFLIDKGDPYTKAARIIANLAVVTAGFIQAENAIKQAGSVSAYAEGTDYHRGGGAIIGEGGQPELLQVNGRSSWITEPTYFPSLPVGASVTPLDDMQQDNREVELLQKLYDKEGAMVKIDVSGKILPTLIKDGRVIRFSNKLIEARG